RHSAAPTVVHRQRIIRVLPGKRISQHSAHPWPQLIPRAVRSAVEGAQENCGRYEAAARRKPRLKRPRVRIQPQHGPELVSAAAKADVGSAAEFYARVPSLLRGCILIDILGRDNLAGLSAERARIGGGS